MFALYFNPAVNTSGTTFYPFFIILIQIVELTQLFFAKVYLHRIVQWAHIFGSSVFVGLSFLLMMDKLMISISELSTGTTASSGFMSNLFYGREAVLLFGVVLTIMTYIVLIMGIVVQGLTGQLTRDKEVVSLDTKGQMDSDEDVRDSEKFVEQDFLDRRTMELAAL